MNNQLRTEPGTAGQTSTQDETNLRSLARRWARSQARGGNRNPAWGVWSAAKGVILIVLQFVLEPPGFLLGFLGLLLLGGGLREFERAGLLMLLDEHHSRSAQQPSDANNLMEGSR